MIRNHWKLFLAMLGTILVTVMVLACDDIAPSSDKIQQAQQEQILKEATAQTGMPAIKNFRERKLMKDILELRDQNGLSTFTYTFSEMTGKYTFFCHSVGYGLPYATQYTSPQKVERFTISGSYSVEVVPQADPNGLFSPASAEGTWVMCKDPNGSDVKPIYLEPRVIVSPFDLEKRPSSDDSAPPTKADKKSK